MLPLPAVDPHEESIKDKDTVHRLESAVVTWSKKIKQVLKADPDAVLKVDQASTPLQAQLLAMLQVLQTAN